MSGRPRRLLDQVDHLSGDRVQKQRLKVIFAVLTGELSVGRACELLGVCESRYHELRQRVLEAALQALSPQPAGRPRALQSSPEVERLRATQSELERELDLMRVREELLLAVPRVLRERGSPAASGEKRGSRRPRSRPMRGKRAR